MNNNEQLEFLTVDQVCEILQVSRPTVYRLIKDGKIKVIKLGTATRIRRSEIDKL